MGLCGIGREKSRLKADQEAAGFRSVFKSWNILPPESRAIAWRCLLTASRNPIPAIFSNGYFPWSP